MVAVDGAVLEHGVPDGERHTEEPLPADAPVASKAFDPVLEPGDHVRRVPRQLASAGEEPLAVGHRADVPLAAGDDLERAIAPLIELHGVGDRPRLPDQVPALGEKLDDALLGLLDRAPLELLPPIAIGHAVGRLLLDAPVAAHD